MQTHPTSTRVLDVIDGVFSLHRLNAVPCITLSTTRRETFTTTQHRNAPRQPRPRAAPVETPPKTSHKTVLLVHTGHDVKHQGPEDNEGKQREVRRDRDQPRRLTHKLVFTVEPSKR